jgi:hypothetical protein
MSRVVGDPEEIEKFARMLQVFSEDLTANCNGICPDSCNAICPCTPIREPAVHSLLTCIYSSSITKTGQRKGDTWYPQRTNTVAVYGVGRGIIQASATIEQPLLCEVNHAQ